MAGFSVHEGGLTDNIGFNRYMVGGGLIDAGVEAAEGGLGFVQDLWNENPNTFQNAGSRGLGLQLG